MQVLLFFQRADKCSVFIFPTVFGVFNTVYWSYFGKPE